MEPAVFRYDQIDEDGHIFQADNLTSPNPRENLRYEVTHPVTGQPVPTPAFGWRYSSDTMSALIADNRIVFGPDESTTPRLKRFLADQEDRVPYPTFTQPRMPGSKRLEAILGDRRFPNPKDVDIIKRWVGTAAGSDAVILDFFGGSGTTTEAVMRLNAEDGGTRQSILVTNNELSAREAKRLRNEGFHPGDPEWGSKGVFEYVCRPRISTAVTGTRPDGSKYSDGLAANVEMFRLTYLDPGRVRRGREYGPVAPLMWMEGGARGERVDKVPDDGWALTESYGVLFSIDALTPFATAVANAAVGEAPPQVLFIITDSPMEYQTAVERLPTGIETMRLYEDYLSNYTINIPGGAR